MILLHKCPVCNYDKFETSQYLYDKGTVKKYNVFCGRPLTKHPAIDFYISFTNNKLKDISMLIDNVYYILDFELNETRYFGKKEHSPGENLEVINKIVNPFEFQGSYIFI